MKTQLFRGMPPGVVGPHEGVICNDVGCVGCDPAREAMRNWAEGRLARIARHEKRKAMVR